MALGKHALQANAFCVSLPVPITGKIIIKK